MIQFTATKILETIEGKKTLSVSFQAQKGEIIALYGDSGVGKTTTLRMLAGLTSSKEIEIAVENEIWDSSLRKIHLPTSKRSIGFVFQDFALFPNLTVRQNLAIALPKGEDQQIIDELLTMMELTQLSDRKPSCLSGGQQQRVALARAIVRKPKILLLDEPLSALDNTLRLKLQDYILEIHKRFELTTIIISHNIAEIFKLANRVLHLSNGKIIQQGTPIEIFNQSKSENQLEFIGEITHRYQKNKLYYIDILIENKIKFIEVTFEEYQHYQIGNRIILSSKMSNFNLTKTNIKPKI